MEKFELTEKGKRTVEIILPANAATGDRLFKCRTSSINDAVAAVLLARKDGKGAEYVQEKKQAPASESKAFFRKKKETPDEDPEPLPVRKITFPSDYIPEE